MKNISIVIDKTYLNKIVISEKKYVISISKMINFMLKNIKHKIGHELNVSMIETFQGVNVEPTIEDLILNKELRKLAIEYITPLIFREYPTKIINTNGHKKEAGVDSSVYTRVDDAIYNSESLKLELNNSDTSVMAKRGLIDYVLLISGDGDYINLINRVPSSIGFVMIGIKNQTNKIFYSKLDDASTWRFMINIPDLDKAKIAFNVEPLKGSISKVNIINSGEEIDYTKTIVYLNVPGNICLRENGEKSGLMIPFLKTKLPMNELIVGRGCTYDVDYVRLTKGGRANYDFVAINLQLDMI